MDPSGAWTSDRTTASERATLINNFAFVLAEDGQTAAAESMLSKISSLIHLQPYPTATLGLICLRKGKVDRGRALYSEAIGLALDRFHKDRIRQKLNFELGKYWIDTDTNKARNYLAKASGGKAEPALAQDAARIMNSIGTNRDSTN